MSETASGCAVLFDLDGTLVDSEPIHHQALLDVLEAEDILLHPDIADRTTGLSIQAVYDLLVANHDDFAIDYPAFVFEEICGLSDTKTRSGTKTRRTRSASSS